ncbi:soxG: sarcosine oxidase, gamma subunit family [compost metagenome]
MLELKARSTHASRWVSSAQFPISNSLLRIEERPMRAIIRLQGARNDERFESAVQAIVKLSLPGNGAYLVNGSRSIAWVGPSEWLLFAELQEEAELLSSLNQALSGVFASATLMSDARICLTVQGPAAVDFLAKGCSVDIDPNAFPPGRVIATRMAQQPSMVIHESPGSYALYFESSLAAFTLNWVIECAAEFV